MQPLQYLQKSEFDRVRLGMPDDHFTLGTLADMCRINTLVEVKKAGSGHLGSSFSAMDINVWLYFREMNVVEKGIDHPDRDIFFSSKGHDVPGLYAVFHALGILPDEKLLSLRRLGGLDGHPDIHLPGCESNTGSLGMGIAKGRGMARAKEHQGRGGRVFVMTGDGELQEGQIWESLQTTAHQKTDITVIVDHNKLQTDMPVEEISGLGDLEAKFRAFGWVVRRCGGHDFSGLEAAFRFFRETPGPKILIADTVKGRGVTFMEKISAEAAPCGKYLWHSGAPADEPFASGLAELVERVNTSLSSAGLAPLRFTGVPQEAAPKSTVTRQYVAAAYGEELVRLAATHTEIIVLDADLSADCKLRGFEEKFPGRFIENGIAEQDMVSMAGGLAAQGLLPVCNSFGSFLCARANEQIYNNCCEGGKIIYAAHFAGMIPAGPGKSHQCVRDIGLLGSLSNMAVLQPCNLEEARMATRWAVEEATTSVCLRMNIGPSPSDIILPPGYTLVPGRGVTVREGEDAAIIAYGPVMLHEAISAADHAAAAGLSVAVINLPWLTRFDMDWVASATGRFASLYTLDDHMISGGMGERLVSAMAERCLSGGRRLRKFGLEVLPACGTPIEVLRHHRLDGASLADAILADHRLERDKSVSLPVYNTPEAAQ